MAKQQTDPVLASARREMGVALVLFAAALVYTCGYCYLYGYGRSPESLTFVLGFPDWVFWGVVVPWGVFFLLSCWFAFGFMQDVPLAPDPADGTSQQSPPGEDVAPAAPNEGS